MNTPLSPAAAAVLDAYMANCGWLDGPLGKDYRCAAAVLRAGAKYLNATSPWPGHIESMGVNWSRNELHAIADELDSQS